MKSVFFSKQKSDDDLFFDITINLNCPLNVPNHCLALGELSGRIQSKNERRRTPLYLCCDLCEDSNVMNAKMPVLRQVIRSQGGNISNPVQNLIWCKLVRDHITTIRLYISDVDGELQPLSNCLLNGTLIFKNEKTYS